MKIEFTKMHGCGNDYVYIDGERFHIDDDRKPDIVRFISDRHKGVGSDGVIFINPSDEADYEMDMYNSDGSRSEMCGNGIRCVAKYVYDKGKTDKRTLDIISHGKIKHIELGTDRDGITMVKVDMGEPILNPELIPVNISMLDPSYVMYGGDVQSMTDEADDADKVDETSKTDSADKADTAGNAKATAVRMFPVTADGAEYKVTCISMGNPHAIIYVDDTAGTDVDGTGSILEKHPFFPNRTNVEFVQNIDRTHVKMRVWERGTGETLACGTGCCALTVAGVLNGLYDRDTDMDIEVRGGHIIVNYSSDGHVYMTGPAQTVYEGTIGIK